MWTMIALGALLVVTLVLLSIGRFARKAADEPLAEGLDYRSEQREKEQRKQDAQAALAFRWGALAVLAVFVFVLLANSVKIVGANEVGVPRTLGRIGSPLQSGPHLVAPWTEVEKLPTRPRTVTTVTSIRTNESGHGRVRIATRWNTDEKNAAELYQQARTSDEDRIQKEIIAPQVDGAANEWYGGRTNVQTSNGSNWADNATGIFGKVQERLKKYGIHLVSVEIREVAPDSDMNRALGLVAAQDAKTALAVKQDETAKKEALVRLTEATGIKDAAAELKGLTPDQIALLCLQAQERVANLNAAKGLATYTTVCGGGSTSVIAK